jgi:hypothetical protein
MKRTPLKHKSATKRRTTSPRCTMQRCNGRAEIAGLCVSHAEKRAWREFSLFIRTRDARCTAAEVLGTPCLGDGLQAAHIVGRRNQAVRYDPENVHAACPGHHMTVDQAGQEHAKYRWAVALLGESGYAALMERANVMGDRREAIRQQLEASV